MPQVHLALEHTVHRADCPAKGLMDDVLVRIEPAGMNHRDYFILARSLALRSRHRPIAWLARQRLRSSTKRALRCGTVLIQSVTMNN